MTATGPSPFKVEDNQRPERTGFGVRKPPPESSVPGGNLTRGSRRNQLRRGHGSPPVLGEVPHEPRTAAHSKECKRSPQQFIPAGFPLHDNLPTGMEDSASPSPHRTWSVPDASSKPQLNLYRFCASRSVQVIVAPRTAGKSVPPLHTYREFPGQSEVFPLSCCPLRHTLPHPAAYQMLRLSGRRAF